jgi:hypothetical protein
MTTINLEKLINIPMDVMGIIYEFIPINMRRILTKKEYSFYYSYFISSIANNNRLDTYTRRLIRKKQSFPFGLLILMKYNIWYKIKNVRSKIGHTTLVKAPNYIIHLKELCNYYNSNACKIIILDYEKSNGKKTYKKIKFNNIRWSN